MNYLNMLNNTNKLNNDMIVEMVKVISLTIAAVIISLFLISFGLACRDGRMYPSNFSVGDASVANLNYEQADAVLKKIIPVKYTSLLQLKMPDKIICIPIKECGISPNFEATLENLNVLLNHDQGSFGLINHSVIRGKNQDINPVYRINKDLLYNKLSKTPTIRDKQAIDAHILYNDGLFKYIPHQNGYLVNFDATMKNICYALQKGDLGPIEVSTTVIYPRFKINDIKKVKDIIGVYAILISPEQNTKGSNLYAETDKLNGTIILPHEVYPMPRNEFNNTLYPLIQSVYKSIKQAGLTVIEQTSGMDKNFYIKNNLNDPVLISAIIKDNKLLVKVFGCQTEVGKQIFLTIEETEVPCQIKVLNDTNMKSGQRKVKQEGKNGLAIKTYRIVTKNGHQLEKTLLTKEVHQGTDTIIIVAPNESNK